MRGEGNPRRCKSRSRTTRVATRIVSDQAVVLCWQRAPIPVDSGWTRPYVPSLERAALMPGSARFDDVSVLPGKGMSCRHPMFCQGGRIDVSVTYRSLVLLHTTRKGPACLSDVAGGARSTRYAVDHSRLHPTVNLVLGLHQHTAKCKGGSKSNGNPQW